MTIAAGFAFTPVILGAQAAQPATGVSRGGAASEPTTLSAAERERVNAVDQSVIRQLTSTLAAPDMEGRGTATAGGDRAAQFLADQFKAAGFAPAGDSGTYFQRVPFISTRIDTTTAITTPRDKLHWGSDFVLVSRPGRDSIDLSAPAVFVGYGVVAPALKRNDIASVDMSGKVAVILRGRPRGVNDTAWAVAANPSTVVRTLASRGAVAFLFVNVDTPGEPYSVIADYLVRRRVEVDDGGPPPSAIVAYLSQSGADRLWAGSAHSYADDRNRAETGDSVTKQLQPSLTIKIRARSERRTGSNVLGVLRGSDPALAKQAVMLTAHYDAYGKEGSRIYPGAADNALGVGTMVAVGTDLGRGQRTRRSVLLAAVTGEEYGLLGAAWWADHPTWPVADVVADLNFDGIGTEVYGQLGQVVGFGAEYSTLGSSLNAAAKALGLAVAADPFPEEQAFYRSDHFALVQHGIPALMLLGGPAGDSWRSRAKQWLGPGGDYHQPGDSVRTDWDWRGPRTLAQLTLLLTLRLADSPTTPSWNPGGPFKRQGTENRE